MSHSRIRRRALGLGAVLLTASLALTACAPAADTAEPAAAGDYGDITVQLSWLKNHEFSGLYSAIEDGYFTDAGFGNVELTAGGIGGVAAEAALSSGTAWIGLASPVTVAQANSEGADLRIVATLYQKNPFTLVSADTNPITDPQQLIGKTIAIADSSAANWEAFLAANDIDPSQVNRVPYGDANTSLTLGQIDGFMGYGNGGADLRAAGFGAQEFFLADYGLDYSGEALVVTADTLKNEPDKVEAFLTAYAQGWKAAFDDVDKSIDLVVNKYGADQKYTTDEIQIGWDQQAKLILTDESLKNGIATISDRAIKANIDTIKLVGVDATADSLFDPTLIAEVYKNHPELIIGE